MYLRARERNAKKRFRTHGVLRRLRKKGTALIIKGLPTQNQVVEIMYGSVNSKLQVLKKCSLAAGVEGK